MKRSVSASVLVAIAFGNMTAAYAGFEVIPSYEYTGAKPPVIQSTQALQSTRPDKNIFIDEPDYNNGRGYVPASPQTRMLASNTKYGNNLITDKATGSVMKAGEVQALLNNLNHITFVGTPPSVVSVTSSSGNSSSLKGGMQKIIPSEYTVLLYPSVQKKSGKKPVHWVGGERWLISLDKVLDSNNLKAVVVWSDLKVYVSEEKENIVPFTQQKSSSPKIVDSPAVNNKPTSDYNLAKSPFTKDINQVLNKKLGMSEPDKVVNILPVTAYRPVTLINWTSQSGIMLSAMINDWATKQGWKVIWRSDKDYNIVTPFTVTSKDKSDAGFLEAMKKVFELYDRAQYPFKVDAYPDQKLMFVTTKGDNKG